MAQKHSNISVGVDIGGTKITAGLVADNKITATKTLPTPAGENQQTVINAIIKACKEVLDVQSVSGIGVGVPGLVDTAEGIVYDASNIPSFKSVELKKILEQTFGKPVYVNNDANCFALGAKNIDEGKNYKNIVGLTLGTGLGGGIIINNHLYEGVGGGAGEFGYLPYRDGILEHYCSGQFFKRKYDVTGEEAFALAQKGDSKAFRMFDVFGFHVGEAIKIAAHLLAPEAIMLGGSIAKSFDYFKESMWMSVRRFPYKNVIDNLEIIPVHNPGIAVIGAASLVFD